MNDMAEHLFAVLPAPTRAEIAERLSKRLGRPVSISEVDRLLSWVRRNNAELGWLPFYAPRGKNATDADRYIVTWITRDGTFHSDTEGDACDLGSVSTLRMLLTTTQNYQSMLLALACRTTGRKRPRMLRGVAGDMQYFETKVASILEEFDEADGAA